MAVTDVTSLSITKFQLGVQVTKVTDSSADWSSVANNTYFYDKGDQLVHFKNSSGTVLELFSAGGLTYFTEAQSTASPNDTVYVDSVTAVSSVTNTDVAIVPKGTGAILGAIPNSAVSGGNKRGAGAVDLQTSRSSANQVAAGQYSVIVGGQNNRANGGFSLSGGGNGNISGGGYAISMGSTSTANGTVSIAIGDSNSASANYSSSIGGISNTASGQSSSVMGSSSSTASALYSGVFGGQLNTASNTFSCVLGGVSNIASGYNSYAMGRGVNAFSRGRQSRGHRTFTSGDCQKSEFFLGARTTDATTTTLTNAGDFDLSTAQVMIAINSSYRFKGTIIGKQSASTNTAAWDIDGVIVQGTTAVSTTLVVSNVNLVSNNPGWGTPILSADTTNGALTVQVIGLAATNIQWTCIVETTEVIYA
jgi:hypothetical protein